MWVSFCRKLKKNSITLCPGVAVEETQTRKNKNFLGDSNR